MDSLSIAKDIGTSLRNNTKAAEDILRLPAGHNRLEDDVLSRVRISLEKYQDWQQKWSGEASNPGAAAEALWGDQGWRIVQGMLNKLLEDSDHVGKYLDHIRESPTTKPRSKWKVTVKALRPKQQSIESLKEILDLTAALPASIDRLWLYSDSVFDSLHRVSMYEAKLPESEKLLTLALQSRAGSLDLHILVSDSPGHCCLKMDLLDAESLTFHTSNRLGHPSRRLFYHLFAETRESPQEIKVITVENIPEPDESAIFESESARNDIVESNKADIQLFKSQPGTGTKWTVSRRGSNPPSCLFLQPSVGTKLLETKPERLNSLLKTREKRSNATTVEYISIGAKIELAYKVIECGFFLIGTPWFSSLSSKNIKRMRSLGQKRNNFMLDVQTLDHHDMVSDDPGALAETTHLFRIGILLMEIALGEPNDYPRIDNDGHDEAWISKLPLIERAMGTQYCEATAFCLHYRQPNYRFRAPEKYQGENFVEWQSYLAGFLREYYLGVFLRYAVRAVSKSLDELRTLTWFRLQKLRELGLS